MERPLHIGNMQVRLWDGSYIFEDLRIDGLKPDSIPFFTAKRIVVSMSWSPLFNRRLVFDTIELTDWRMHVEVNRDGTQSLPKLTPRGPRGPSSWTTTLRYVHAGQGEFTYQDHNTPWGIVARNLNVTVARPGSEYVGQAKFSDGVTAIQGYVPFRTDMSSTFKIDGGRVIFDRINLETEGTQSVLNGDVNLLHFPELMFQVKSTIDLPRMRELFFAGDTFTLNGTSEFLGTFHLFKEPRADGTTRTGRELKGTFHSGSAGVNDFQFADLRGTVRWTPEVLRISEAATKVYGGDARFSYLMAPLGVPGVTPKATFDAAWDNIDLTEFSNDRQLEGIRLAGRLSGQNRLEWPVRRFSARTGRGKLHFVPPEGVTLMTREMPLDRIREVEKRGRPAGPFSPLTPRRSSADWWRSYICVWARADRSLAESSGHGVDAGRVRRADRLRWPVAHSLSRVERRLAGERSCVRWFAHGLWRSNAGDSDRRVRHVRRCDDGDIQASANRRGLRG